MTRSIFFVNFFALLSLMFFGCSAPKTIDESQVLSRITQLTDGFDRAGEAYFSPKQDWIVFQVQPKGETHYQMYVAKLGWSALMDEPSFPVKAFDIVRISPTPSKNTCGFFSPDGNSLILASTAGKEATTQPTSAPSPGYQRSSGTYRWEFPKEMEIFRADGWEAAVNAATGAKATDLAKHRLTNNDAYDAECAFSPDGKWIIFTSLRTGDAELFAMRADGSDVVQLTHTKGYDGGPFFSPNGKRIVYRSDRAGNDLLQIYTSDLVRDQTGRILGLCNERQLTRGTDVNWGPYWHPDGKHIIYATSIHGHQNYELYMMRSDGSRKTRITFTDGFDGLPVFSPDGKFLMWSSKRSKDKTTQIFIARFEMLRRM